MGKVDGLIIPRSYNDYFSRSDPGAIRDIVAIYTDDALSDTSENPVQNKVVKDALDVINAVIPAGASANDKLALKSSVDAIDAKIPTQASAQNQLADKDFVNSSVSTNTANYISDNGEPFASVAALEAYSGTVTNNDYAFVTGTDAAGNVYYDRYKATVSGASVSWAKEYRLNNSSFTAAQWAAISSGITAAKVAQYDAGVTPVDVVEEGNLHAVTSNAVAETLHISDFSSISGGYVNSFTCTETGFYYLTVHTYFSNGSFDGIKINNGSIGGCASSTGTGNYYSTMTMLLKKGDLVTIANGIGNSAFNVRGYSKLSDFFN